MDLKTNKFSLFIAIIIILDLHFFYLVDSEKVPIEDINLIIKIIFVIYVYIKCKPVKKSQYKIYFFIPVFLMFTSAYMANLNYKQPLIMGIRPQRYWIISMLMYFPISRVLKAGYINYNQIYKLIDKINIVYFCICGMQYIIGDKIKFMYVMSNERYGSIRLYVCSTFMLISYFCHLKNILEAKKIKFSDVFFIFITLFMELYITKSRMRYVIVIVISLLAVLTSRKYNCRKIMIIYIITLGACIFINSNMGHNIMDALIGNASVDEGTKIREVGRVFYIEQTMKNPLNAIFGCGVVNTNWQQAIIGARYLEGIYYNDNGIFGLFFYYGFSFVIWFIIFHLKVLRDALKVRKKECFLFLICGVLGIYTLLPYCYARNIAFPLICSILEEALLSK